MQMSRSTAAAGVTVHGLTASTPQCFSLQMGQSEARAHISITVAVHHRNLALKRRDDNSTIN